MIENLKSSTGKHEKVGQKPLQKNCKISYKNQKKFQPTETSVGFSIFGTSVKFFGTELNTIINFIKRNTTISSALKCALTNGRNAR